MFKKLMSNVNEQLGSLSGPYRKKVREKAIQNAKSRIVLSEKNIQDLSEDELEILVKEEEDKIYDNIKTKGLYAALALLGINII